MTGSVSQTGYSQHEKIIILILETLWTAGFVVNTKEVLFYAKEKSKMTRFVFDLNTNTIDTTAEKQSVILKFTQAVLKIHLPNTKEWHQK